MNDELPDELAGAIRRVRERYEFADSWQTWADEFLAGAVMKSVNTMEAASAAATAMVIAERVGKRTEPSYRIARAASAIAHIAALALIYGDAVAPAMRQVVETVEREIQSG